MRKGITSRQNRDPRIQYRGEEPSRLDVLTDAVFGIAITLLIFNLDNSNTFEDLIHFAQTIPALLLSISFLMLIWMEHMRFSIIYRLEDGLLVVLNTLFIALVIFYVYPLRFLSFLLTDGYFGLEGPISITEEEVPKLMIYYGTGVFLLYLVISLFYARALSLKNELNLNKFEIFHTKQFLLKSGFMAAIPLLSILIIIILQPVLGGFASGLGGMTYFLYIPVMIYWGKQYRKKEKSYPLPTA